MPRSYKISSEESYTYFVTCSVIEHLPLFESPSYAKIVLDSLAYIREYKQTRLNAFVLMSTHLHMVLWPKNGVNLSDLLRDFKRFTSRSISRMAQEWNDKNFLDQFASARLSGRMSNDSKYQVWQDGSHPEAIYGDDFARQKIEYIHLNPVKAGLVAKAEDWLYSMRQGVSARQTDLSSNGYYDAVVTQGATVQLSPQQCIGKEYNRSMPHRLKKTLLDYLVIAISPALIMLMVGSLVFFLIEVFYQGNFTGRLLYIFALFVMAAVLVARISIEQGRERAFLFAVPLGIVTLLAINRFVQFQGGILESLSFFINLGLIAVVWWSADKLTWDCTLIDEDQEDTGEGLLEAVGLEKSSKGAMEREIAPLPEVPEATTSRDEPPSWWHRFIERRRRPHAPGVWVIYFSLAALPLFGIGQLFIPAANLADRQNAFNLLCVYTASGLGLLLTTSFLGLRRYLRQRRQEMPLSIVNLWLIVGGAIIAGVMLAAMLLPRPNAEYAISAPPFRIGSPDQHASQYGAGREGVEENQPSAQSQERQDEQSGSTSPNRPGKTPSDKANKEEKADKTPADKADQPASDKTTSEKPKKPPGASGKSAAEKQSTGTPGGGAKMAAKPWTMFPPSAHCRGSRLPLRILCWLCSNGFFTRC